MELKDNPILTILVSTLNEGIKSCEKIVRLVHPKVKFLIIHQNPKNSEVPAFLQRDDIEVISSKTKGLCKSRNLGLANCKTKYALIADDDVEYINEGIEAVVEAIENDAPDFAVFKIQTHSGEPEYKNYTPEKHKIQWPLKHWVSSIEILLNVEVIREKGIQFDERFGLGTRLKKGEENILMFDCVQNHLLGIYYPTYLVKHPFESSGKTTTKKSFDYMFGGAMNSRLKRPFYIENRKSFIDTIRFNVWWNIGWVYIRMTKG